MNDSKCEPRCLVMQSIMTHRVHNTGCLGNIGIPQMNNPEGKERIVVVKEIFYILGGIIKREREICLLPEASTAFKLKS